MLRLKYERRQLGWSQTVLAYYAGMSIGDISRIESGRLRPYPSQLTKLANILDVDEGELLLEVSPGVAGGADRIEAHA